MWLWFLPIFLYQAHSSICFQASSIGSRGNSKFGARVKKSNCPVGDDEDEAQTCKELPQQQQPCLKLLQGLVSKTALLQVVVQLSDQHLAEGVEENLQEGVEHAEDHPYVNHLGIRRRR